MSYQCIQGHFTDKEHENKNCPYDSKSKVNDLIDKYSDSPSEDKKKVYIPPKLEIEPKTVEINLNSEIQKQFNNAKPKERATIARQYILDSLRGKYPTNDGLEVYISRKTAKEITHTTYEPKLRATPQLVDLIKNGVYIKEEKATHGTFERFIYYKVKLSIKNIVYTAYLNIGVIKQNISTLYDINQFNEEK